MCAAAVAEERSSAQKHVQTLIFDIQGNGFKGLQEILKSFYAQLVGFWITCFWFAVIAKLKEFLIDIIDLGPAEVAPQSKCNTALPPHKRKTLDCDVQFQCVVC